MIAELRNQEKIRDNIIYNDSQRDKIFFTIGFCVMKSVCKRLSVKKDRYIINFCFTHSLLIVNYYNKIKI